MLFIVGANSAKPDRRLSFLRYHQHIDVACSSSTSLRMNWLPSIVSFSPYRSAVCCRVWPRLRQISILCCALAFASLFAQAGSEPRKRTLPIAGDALPQTPELDQLEARLVLGSHGWKIAAIGAAKAQSRLVHHSGSLESSPFVSPLRFVLSDIDSDSDLDVIVINRISGRAQSVWRNNGGGPFERVQENRYGRLRFPEGQLSRRDDASADSWLPATCGSVVRISRALAMTPLVQADASLRELVRHCHNHIRSCSSGRAPPAGNSLS